MRITELFTAQSIALDEALTDQEQIISRLVELQATHGNITDKDAYKKALYAREAEGSTYVDNGITVPHAKTNVVTRPSLAALRLSSPVQYNAEDDGTTDLLFAIAAPENGSLHVDMLARMMQMLMNEDFVEKLKAAKTPAEFLDCIDAQEEAQFGAESFTQQEIPQSGYRILAVTACVNGIAHTYMAAEALTKAGDKLGLPTKVETNGSDGAKNILIATHDGQAVCFDETDVRAMGRTAVGVRGIRLREGDYVVGAARAEAGKTVLSITERGYGKRTPVEEYRITSRGGLGIRNYMVTEKTGPIVGIKVVDGQEDLLLMTQAGILIRTAVDSIRIAGRATQGVIVMRFKEEGDHVISMALADRETEKETAPTEE